MNPNEQSALAGLRVIDLTHPYGHYCGKVLADLGADVVKVEPLEGDPGRRFGPFKDGRRDLEASLFFASYNTNKRSLAVDLASPEGQALFRRLVERADAVIHTPDHLAFPGLEVSYEALKAVNPRIVVAAITGFSPGGPYSRYRSTSQTVFALSGIMKNIGPPEGPPEAAPGQIAFDLAALDAASGIVCALLASAGGGHGQQISVAAHEVLASEINPRAPEQFDATRYPHSSNPQLAPSGAFPCKDGEVTVFTNLPGHWQGLRQLLGNPPELEGDEWNDRTYRQRHAEFVTEMVLKGFAGRTQAELTAEGQKLHVPCGPVNTVATFANDPHAAARQFFVTAGSAALGTFKMPGAPYKLSEAGWSLRRPAPELGQDTRAILQDELGYAPAEVDRLQAAGVIAAASSTPRAGADRAAGERRSWAPLAAGRGDGRPLAGVRAVAFTTAFAGPTVGRYLADLGAEVIKVESRRRWDNTRHASSAGVASVMEPGGAPTAPGFGYFNRNQLGVSIDLSRDEARELMLKLLAKTDVVIENFSFQVLQKWGFTYDKLTAVKPDIIMLDMQGFGQTGPFRDYISFGSIIHSYSGLASLWGSAHGFFVDYVAAEHAVFAVLSALMHRQKTGRGVHIDMAQLEAAGAVLGVPYLDYFVNGFVQRHGDGRMLQDAPAGCYPCKGADAWCVIEVTGDGDWRRLREAMGNPAWSEDARYATAGGRLAGRGELDRRLAEWTQQYGDTELQDRLQAAGVPAARVLSGREVFEDAHLNAVGFYETIDHVALGPWKYPRLPLRLSGAPDVPDRPAPTLGEHNGYVFGELLGLSGKEIERLTAEGVLS